MFRKEVYYDRITSAGSRDTEESNDAENTALTTINYILQYITIKQLFWIVKYHKIFRFLIKKM